MALSPFSTHAADAIGKWMRRGSYPKRSPLNRQSKQVIRDLCDKIAHAKERARKMIASPRDVRTWFIKADRAQKLSGGTHFLPTHIKDHVTQYVTRYLVYTFRIGGRRVNIRFAVYGSLDRTPFDRMAERVLSWLLVCSTITRSTACSTKLDIFFLRAPFEKRLPKSDTEVLGPNHVNSGYATSCAKQGEIVIFRREEWFKVLIHESFHAFGFDLGAADLEDVSRSVLKVDASHAIYEAYTETWARMINVFYCALDSPKSVRQKMVGEMLEIECIFSVIQAAKALDHMGTDYRCLLSGDDCGYTEKTNVLAYYVITAALLSDMNAFLTWCSKYAEGFLRFPVRPKPREAFANLLIRALRRRKYIDQLHSSIGWPGTRGSKKVDLAMTMRMTCIDCNEDAEN